jgi:hypothetical protein
MRPNHCRLETAARGGSPDYPVTPSSEPDRADEAAAIERTLKLAFIIIRVAALTELQHGDRSRRRAAVPRVDPEAPAARWRGRLWATALTSTTASGDRPSLGNGAMRTSPSTWWSRTNGRTARPAPAPDAEAVADQVAGFAGRATFGHLESR